MGTRQGQPRTHNSLPNLVTLSLSTDNHKILSSTSHATHVTYHPYNLNFDRAPFLRFKVRSYNYLIKINPPIPRL